MRKCKAGRDFATPSRYDKVSGYTMSNKTTKTLPSLMSCFTVILTDSLNSNMGFLRAGAAVDAPTTAVRRALVGGYEVFARFTSGNELPLLTTNPRGGEPLGDTQTEPWPRCLFAGDESASILFRLGFQFFMHNVEVTGAARLYRAASSD